MEALATRMAPWSLEASGHGGRDMGILELFWILRKVSEGDLGETHKMHRNLDGFGSTTFIDQGHLFRIGAWLMIRSRVRCAVTTFLMEMLTPSAETCRAEGLGLAGWHGTCSESV